MSDPTRAQLDELKDQITFFKENPIWLHILAFMQQIYADSAEEALNNPDKSIVCAKAAGRAEAVRMIAEFDHHIAVLRAAKGGE